MTFPAHKTKVVCTIGPASESLRVLERMIQRGMDIARINLAHGDLPGNESAIRRIRCAAAGLGRRVAILADLPGPKIRLGDLAVEPVHLARGGMVTLTSAPVGTDGDRIPVAFPGLATSVRPGDAVFISDGFIRLRVESVAGDDVHCRVLVGGTLRSHKGVNLPGADLGVSAVTEEDLRLLQFAIGQGVDAVSVSFVSGPEDLRKVRELIAASGHSPFVIAKIERAIAIQRFAAILEAADGVMVARGDLGVETPIEEIALLQKRLIREANFAGKPVITATQMLESMTDNSRPTRAEATDVANAVLDGTDAVMLSEESAVGAFPVESVGMLSKIVRVAEAFRQSQPPRILHPCDTTHQTEVAEAIALNVVGAAERLRAHLIITPTETGATPRRVSRYKPRPWIVALSRNDEICQQLQFSYGVFPVTVSEGSAGWKSAALRWCHAEGITKGLAVMTQGASQGAEGGTNRMEVFNLSED
jgi:pyruvate kinase